MTVSVQTISTENRINLLMSTHSQALLDMFELVLPKEKVKKINYLDCQTSD